MRLQRLKQLTYKLNGCGFYDEPRNKINAERISFLKTKNAQDIEVKNYWILEFLTRRLK